MTDLSDKYIRWEIGYENPARRPRREEGSPSIACCKLILLPATCPVDIAPGAEPCKVVDPRFRYRGTVHKSLLVGTVAYRIRGALSTRPRCLMRGIVGKRGGIKQERPVRFDRRTGANDTRRQPTLSHPTIYRYWA